MLRVQNVHKNYGTPQNPVPALRGVSFELAEGEFCSIVGPSGSGKSTLLHCIGGLETFDLGEIYCGDYALHDISESRLTRYRRSQVGFIFQFFHLIPTLTVLENIELPARLNRMRGSTVRKRAQALLEEVGIANRKYHKPHQLSGGEQQRAAIARALIHSPPLVLADEPTGNLDSASGQQVLDLLLRLQKAHKLTLLMVTHNPATASLAQRRIKITDGIAQEIR
ncbi:MAG: ABC transporter ATP-binding protein [Methylacidiphilales bacterium]|nr:ABC transporter ATP-binding protein [Candidatus Methylacidiphilales bacterium]MDW8349041.1 ABC transporter ATP-binding protein [Verrucomicrobiae bacterium]